MSLSTALSAAVTGLNVNQRGLEIASHNIGNAHTEGYSRRIMHQETISTANFVSGGVTVGAVERAADEFLVDQVRTESASLGKAQTREQYFRNLQDMFGSISSNSSVGQQLADLSARMETLAVEPESPTSALSLIDTAITLARDMNDMSKRVLDLRHDADVEIDQVVDQVNLDLECVAKLNRDIQNAANTALDSGDLKDSRDQALKRIGEAINIRTFERDTGEVVVFTGDSRILVDIDPVTIEYTSSSTAQLGTPFDTISIGGASIQADIRDGKLKGLLEVRDKVLPNLHSELDTLAVKTRDVVNQAHNRGMGLPASNSLAGIRTFTDTATETVTLDVDIRIATTSSNGLIQSHFDLPAGAYTLDAMTTALNDGFTAAGLPGGPVATATVTTSGLTITAANAAHGVGIADLNGGDDATVSYDDGSGAVDFAGFSNFFGLNDLFATDGLLEGGPAQNASSLIEVRSDVVANPALVSRGRLSTDPTVPVAGQTRGISIGDGSIASQMAAALSENQSFDAVGGLPPINKPLHEYAAEIIGLNSQLAADASEKAAFEEALIEQFETRQADFSGVSIDEELANILTLQNAFSASARVVTTVDEMLDVILGLKR